MKHQYFVKIVWPTLSALFAGVLNQSGTCIVAFLGLFLDSLHRGGLDRQWALIDLTKVD